MSEYLNAQEIKSLTDAARVPAQAAWLKERGIPHKVEAKRIIVSRLHVQAWLEDRPIRSTTRPNFAALASA